jgi:hypothetical protein
MLKLSKDRELRAQWQRAAELLLAQADVADLSKQIDLALFYDGKLDVAAMEWRSWWEKMAVPRAPTLHRRS